MKKLSITFYQRKPYVGHWSIEGIFAKLKDLLKDKLVVNTHVASFISRGLFKRVYIAIEAIFSQSDVNHITGDIHYIAAFLKKSKTILTIHDCRILHETPSFIKRKIFYFIWYKMPAKRVQHITVVSAFTKKELLKYIPSIGTEKITVIPPFISERFVQTYRNFNKTKPAILHIGTAVNKNLDRLIEAIKSIECTLTIIGKLSEPQKEKLNEYKIDHRLLKEISDNQMVNEFNNTDILAFVSTFEGFGMPIIEANRVGRVVVTSNITSMPEVAQDAACLVDPFDVESITSGFKKVIEDGNYRNYLITNGYKNASRYDNKMIAQQYFDLYCRIGKK